MIKQIELNKVLNFVTLLITIEFGSMNMNEIFEIFLKIHQFSKKCFHKWAYIFLLIN